MAVQTLQKSTLDFMPSKFRAANQDGDVWAEPSTFNTWLSIPNPLLAAEDLYAIRLRLKSCMATLPLGAKEIVKARQSMNSPSGIERAIQSRQLDKRAWIATRQQRLLSEQLMSTISEYTLQAAIQAWISLFTCRWGWPRRKWGKWG